MPGIVGPAATVSRPEMTHSRYTRDRGLAWRMGVTMFLLGLLYVVVIGLLLALGIGWFFALVIASGALLAQQG